MKKQPRVKLSIIILNFNTEDLLKDCLSSLPVNDQFETIVVDNGSTDDSVNMVEAKFPDVKLIKSKNNLGYTRGNNLARNVVAGECVLFLNSDTTVDRGTLEAMVNLMDEDKTIGISTCLTLLPDGKLYYACHRGFPTPWNSLCYFSGLAKLFPKSKLFAGYTASYLPLDTIHEIDACSGTFLLIQKKLLDQINWFDEDYFSYGEDLEMCYSVKQLGYKIVFNPKVKITHYWGASSGLKSSSKTVSNATGEIKQKWNKARYEAMKIFYQKHFQQKHSFLFNQLVLLGIRGIMYLRSRVD